MQDRNGPSVGSEKPMMRYQDSSHSHRTAGAGLVKCGDVVRRQLAMPFATPPARFRSCDAEPLAVRINDAVRKTWIGRSKLYELIAAGELRTVKIWRCTLVPIAALKELLDGGERHARGWQSPCAAVCPFSHQRPALLPEVGAAICGFNPVGVGVGECGFGDRRAVSGLLSQIGSSALRMSEPSISLTRRSPMNGKA